MSIYKIYKITNAVNGKVYIGQTKGSIRSRFTQHCRPDNPCVALRNAINKYGKNCFFIEVIDTAINDKELDKKEIFWIKQYRSTDNKYGYNIAAGGNVTAKTKRVVCLDTRKKYDSIVECANDMNLSAHMIGEVCNGRKPCHKNLRFAFLDENDKPMFYKLKPKKQNKHVMCLETGVIYDSCLAASKALNMSRNAVSQVAYGKTPTAHNLHFFFVDVNGKPIVNISILKRRTKYCPVLCVETGVVYNSPKEASKETGIYKECIFQSIRKGCYGGGYHWEKVNKGVVRVDI